MKATIAYDRDPKNYMCLYEDDYLTPSEMTVLGNINGANATNNSTDTFADERHPGVRVCKRGTTATGRACIRMKGNSFQLSGGELYYRNICQVGNLSDATNEFLFWSGLYDNTSNEATDGVYFYYDRAASGDFWIAVTANSGTRTKTVTATAVTANDWFDLEIFINAAGTSATFFINRALVATITTNIPTGGTRQTGWCFGGRGTAGTSNVYMGIADYTFLGLKLTTPRWAL